MKVKVLLIACLFGQGIVAQDLSYSKPGSTYYKELPNPVMTNLAEWSKVSKNINVSYGSDNIRYPKEKVPAVSKRSNWNTKAWKGEKVHTQILLWSKVNIPAVSFEVSDLISKKGSRISSKNVKPAFVRYVMSDEFDTIKTCSQGPSSKYDSSLVSDPIDIVDQLPVEANTVQPLWLTVEVPSDIPAGKYSGTVTIQADKKFSLKIAVEVLNRTLPPPAEWKYDFDIWQYPAPVARIHDVPLWSDDHFELMRGYYTYLASAGQKVISANIIEQPWGLDHVHFDDPSLVKWTKKKDGKWDYDFSMFDKYVSFVMSCGITQRINCYSMITWDLGFIYYDEATGKNKTDTLKPATEAYTAFWEPMLKKFTSHLKEKGWFDKATVAMDERPIESMQAVIALLKKIDPQWKIALAGDTYHPEIENDIYDYCLASYLSFDEDVLKRRKAQGKPTTFYTACPEEYPNGYTFSPPAENAWLAWHASRKGLTGYLFWAFNTWVANPLQDARWRRYAAGMLFQFYPGPRTSIRFEKLIEGIQDFEKVRILREQFTKEGKTENLKKIDKMLAAFELEKLKTIPAAEMVTKARNILNQF
ncbi:MAG TPA: glycoside hydrolase domain-containing protein [Hanamia sp.]|nr:glycoside hydrolase domain-containing protein [Hanamia sp.]